MAKRLLFPRLTPARALTVGLVAMLAGLLFSVNARLAAPNQLDRPDGLRGVVQERSQELSQLQETSADLHAQIDSLLNADDAEASPGQEGLSLAAGTQPAAGPGLRVIMNDSPLGEAERPEDLLVHQQDIDAVLSALWAGGAEAATVQGVRLTSTTQVRCVGNVILVGGQVFSPPYTIEAVGPVDGMSQALTQSAWVRRYVDNARSLGLGWSVETVTELELPAAPPQVLKYAKSAAK